jgi:hypothetical protein
MQERQGIIFAIFYLEEGKFLFSIKAFKDVGLFLLG